MATKEDQTVSIEVARDSGPRLRAWVDERPSIIALARESGVSRTQIYRVLDGEFPPPLGLVAAAIRLGAPPELFELRAKRTPARVRRGHEHLDQEHRARLERDEESDRARERRIMEKRYQARMERDEVT